MGSVGKGGNGFQEDWQYEVENWNPAKGNGKGLQGNLATPEAS